MKQITVLILAALLTVSLTACGGKKNDVDNDNLNDNTNEIVTDTENGENAMGADVTFGQVAASK